MTLSVFTILMFVGILIGVFMGFPIAFTLAGLGCVFGFLGWGGDAIVPLLASKSFAVFQNYTYVAIPLFVFMGAMLDKSGVADKAFGVLNYWLRNIKGGLGIATIILCTIFAACTGVVGASVTAMGLLALPPMIKRGYNHSLATGIVGAGGTLGILIPPSIMLVLYGPMASISVVDLFSSAIVPGLMLAVGYLLYVIIYVHVKKDAIVPPAETEEMERYSLLDGVKAFVPFLFIIFMVLGLILFGVCSPTEASAAGAFGSILLAAVYKKLSLKVLFDAAKSSLSTSAMVMFVAVGANIFTSVFFGVGADRVLSNFVLNLGLGTWGTIISVLLLVFVLGMLIDWVGILLIVVPIFMPIIVNLGVDPLWASMLIIVMLQSSFLTPPFAYALFYIKGIAPPGVTIGEIYKGVIPFICIIFGVLILLMLFPGIVSFLPGLLA